MILLITVNILHLETYKEFLLLKVEPQAPKAKNYLSIPILLGRERGTFGEIFGTCGGHQMTNANPEETETVKNKHLESQFAFYFISHQTQGKFCLGGLKLQSEECSSQCNVHGKKPQCNLSVHNRRQACIPTTIPHSQSMTTWISLAWKDVYNIIK